MNFDLQQEQKSKLLTINLAIKISNLLLLPSLFLTSIDAFLLTKNSIISRFSLFAAM